MKIIKINTNSKGNKALAKMSVLNNVYDFTDYDCIIDSGADTFHVNMTKKELGELDFVPFDELKIKHTVPLSSVNGEIGKFVKVPIGTATGSEKVLCGILRCVKIGNLLIKHPVCTVKELTDIKDRKSKEPIFLFPLFYIMPRRILVDQMDNKIIGEMEENSVRFTYYSSPYGKTYSHVDDINNVTYENLLKMDSGKFIPEKDSFVENLLHRIEEEESILYSNIKKERS